MSRLIDADALMECKFKNEIGYNAFCNLVKRQETIDAVPVVRCKDCKFYVEHSLFGVTQGWCERLCDEFDRSMARGTNDDDFCSHGEKKEEA